MRLAERTIELTFCHQVAALWGPRLIWFGLTQDQERRAGFDAATKIGRALLLLQFKASAKVLRRSGCRQFTAPHKQMRALQRQTRFPRLVFYVLPGLGTTAELQGAPNLVNSTWLLDVAALPNPMPRPTTPQGTWRRRNNHYLDLDTRHGVVIIHSDPVEVSLLHPESLRQEQLDLPSVRSAYETYAHFNTVAKHLGPNAIGAIFVP